MKKIITVLTITITLITSVFAGEIKPDQKILKAFEKKFDSAKEAAWQLNNNLYQVTFLYRGETVAAFYTVNAELVCIARNILSTELPFSLQHDLKKKYTGYWISELSQVSGEEGKRFYITVENADVSITLIANDNSTWEVSGTNNKN